MAVSGVCCRSRLRCRLQRCLGRSCCWSLRYCLRPQAGGRSRIHICVGPRVAAFEDDPHQSDSLRRSHRSRRRPGADFDATVAASASEYGARAPSDCASGPALASQRETQSLPPRPPLPGPWLGESRLLHLRLAVLAAVIELSGGSAACSLRCVCVVVVAMQL